MGFFIHNYQGFSGSAADLANLAITCSRNLRLPGDISKISERLIRYYVTEGLLSRPIRIGREAEYHYKHLLQFLASRSLMEEGYPMQKVADYIAGLEKQQLEPLALGQTKPNLAELLVASFKHPEKIARTLRTQKRFTPGNTVDSIPMMSMSSVDTQLDKTQKGSRSNLGSESYLEGMKRTGVVNTRELVNELRLEITEVKHAMSEIVNSLSSIAQPAVLKASDDAQVQLHDSIQQLRCDMDNFCQKIDASLHSLIDKQAELNRFMSIRNEASLDWQEKKLHSLEERIMQLRDEMKKNIK
jgi:DNA-binding transcriptional MerR regulator